MFANNNKIRFWLITAMLLGIITVATSISPALHLNSCAFEHDHSDHSDHSESPEGQTPAHDCSKCPICQVLSGTSCKFVSQDNNSITVCSGRTFSPLQVISTCVYNHNFSPAIPRGPPSSWSVTFNWKICNRAVWLFVYAPSGFPGLQVFQSHSAAELVISVLT